MLDNDFQRVPKGSNEKLRIWYIEQLKKGNKNFFKPSLENKNITRDNYVKESGMKL